ncbi:MAG: glycosyltransferase [Verrucomicrobiota bacterium]
MFLYENNWALVIPMANEEPDFAPLILAITEVIDKLKSGTVYFIVDNVSKDSTLQLCQEVAARDPRFITIWAPENRCIADAYLRGLREAWQRGHRLIIEMDAGLSHDPHAIPMFLRVLNEGNECALGSRYINGGSNVDSPLKRRLFSKVGTILARVLLGAKLKDMTSGYQGYHADIVEKLLGTKILSTAHFYQTELRYLLRNRRIMEVPIHYRAPSPRVSQKAITNSLKVLAIYVLKRLTFSAPEI